MREMLDFANSGNQQPVFAFSGYPKDFQTPRSAPRLPAKIKKLVRPLMQRDSLQPKEIDDLVGMGNPTPQVLRDHALELERKAKEIKRLAGEVRERLIIEELAKGLRIEERGLLIYFAALFSLQALTTKTLTLIPTWKKRTYSLIRLKEISRNLPRKRKKSSYW